MVVALMDPVFSLLDNNNTRSAVIGWLGHRVWLRWSNKDNLQTDHAKVEAFSRPPSNQLNVRDIHVSEIQPIRIKHIFTLWCFPQGSKIGGDCFQGSSNDAKDHVDMEDRFHYVALVFQYYFKRQMIFTFKLSTALALSYCWPDSYQGNLF